MDERLIDAVKNHELLYNKTLLSYRNKFERVAAWRAISQELKLPESVCKARWKLLRDKFVKKIAEGHRASVSGAEMTDSQWQYQEQMSFLAEHVTSRSESASLRIDVPTTSRKRKRRECDSDALNKVLNKMTKIAESRFAIPVPQNECGPHDAFFGMVSELFEDLPSNAVRDAKIYILNYLHDQASTINDFM